MDEMELVNGRPAAKTQGSRWAFGVGAHWPTAVCHRWCCVVVG